MKRRIRHHVNPLSFREQPAAPDWGGVFPDLTRPWEVDVGFGKGQFILARAAQAPEVNLVGLEIRLPMVERARELAARRGLENLHLIRCNANVSLVELLPRAQVRRVYVHFPDPWFKKRHRKRRIIQPAFLRDVAAVLEPGGELHFATDVAEYASSVLELMAETPEFAEGREAAPPFGIETDREAWHRSLGEPIHRYAFPRASGGAP